jgi:dinuclear metal center YbgI/SA1388 family protein
MTGLALERILVFMTMTELEIWFDKLFHSREWQRTDMALNGPQVSCRHDQVTRIAFAVDASLQSFQAAVAESADVLVVHHGLFWGSPLSITGEHFERIKYLIDHDLALFAYHLPLDAHAEVGNNAGIAKALKLQELRDFGEFRGKTIGYSGLLPEPLTLDEICEILFHGRENVLQILPFGKQKVQSVGIISGGASRELAEAIQEKLDLYITGDADHTVYHQALEAGINVIFGGHYATETWGVRQLSQKLTKETGVPVVYLDLPTGL